MPPATLHLVMPRQRTCTGKEGFTFPELASALLFMKGTVAQPASRWAKERVSDEGCVRCSWAPYPSHPHTASQTAGQTADVLHYNVQLAMQLQVLGPGLTTDSRTDTKHR